MSSEEWKNLRKLALERDGFRCRCCNEPGAEVPLEVHHRHYPENFDWEEDDIDNLTTLCPDCHEVITSAMRKKRYENKEMTIVSHETKSLSRNFKKKEVISKTVGHSSIKTRSKGGKKKNEPQSNPIIGYISTKPERRKDE